MRCDRASTIALISHPKYCQNAELLKLAVRIAEAEVIKHFEYAILMDLPEGLTAYKQRKKELQR